MTDFDNSSHKIPFFTATTFDKQELAHASDLIFEALIQIGALDDWTVSATAPTTPAEGDKWMNKSTQPATLQVYVDGSWQNAAGDNVFQKPVVADFAEFESGTNYLLSVATLATLLLSDSVNKSVGLGVGASIEGASNTILGYQAHLNGSGSYNVQIGDRAGYMNAADTSTQTVVIGYLAGYDGLINNAIYLGSQAGYQNTATVPIFMGLQAGYQNTGNSPLGVGYQALYTNSGINSMGIGYRAGYNNAGAGGMFVGYQAGYDNAGNYNHGLGYLSLYQAVGAQSTALGSFSAYQMNCTGFVVALGYQSGYQAVLTRGTFVGTNSGRLANGTNESTFLGYNVGFSATGSYTVAIGDNSFYEGASDFSAFVGNLAGYAGQGTGVVGVGYQTYFQNTSVGDYVTIVGYRAGGGASVAPVTNSNSSAFGANSLIDADNQVVLGSPATEQVKTSGVYISGLYTPATLPPAADYQGAWAYITGGIGNGQDECIVQCDGTNWRKVENGVIQA